jgi:large subunit ribosomal protein L24e
MAKCSICDKHIEHGRGIIYATHDSIYNFCSSKCRKNYDLGRDKRKIAWIRKKHVSANEMKQEILEEEKEKEEMIEEKKQDKQEAAEEKKEEKK